MNGICDLKQKSALTPVSDQDRVLSLLYPYNIMQTSNENKEKYKLWDY